MAVPGTTARILIHFDGQVDHDAAISDLATEIVENVVGVEKIQISTDTHSKSFLVDDGVLTDESG